MTDTTMNIGAASLSDEQIEALKAAALAATPQDIDSAQRIEHYEDGSHIGCPACGGEGSADQSPGKVCSCSNTEGETCVVCDPANSNGKWSEDQIVEWELFARWTKKQGGYSLIKASYAGTIQTDGGTPLPTFLQDATEHAWRGWVHGRAALAAQSANVAQGAEAVAWAVMNRGGYAKFVTNDEEEAKRWKEVYPTTIPLFAAPPAQTALTDDARDAFRRAAMKCDGSGAVATSVDDWTECSACNGSGCAQEGEDDARDAMRYRWLRERAWFVDAATYALELRERWRSGDEPPTDADDVEGALDAALTSAQSASGDRI